MAIQLIGYLPALLIFVASITSGFQVDGHIFYLMLVTCKLGELWVAMVMNDKILLSAAEALFLIRKFEGICSSIFLNSFSC